MSLLARVWRLWIAHPNEFFGLAIVSLLNSLRGFWRDSLLGASAFLLGGAGSLRADLDAIFDASALVATVR